MPEHDTGAEIAPKTSITGKTGNPTNVTPEGRPTPPVVGAVQAGQQPQPTAAEQAQPAQTGDIDAAGAADATNTDGPDGDVPALDTRFGAVVVSEYEDDLIHFLRTGEVPPTFYEKPEYVPLRVEQGLAPERAAAVAASNAALFTERRRQVFEAAYQSLLRWHCQEVGQRVAAAILARDAAQNAAGDAAAGEGGTPPGPEGQQPARPRQVAQVVVELPAGASRGDTDEGLRLLHSYLRLSPREQSRVENFVIDAEHRELHWLQERAWSAVEDFWGWLSDRACYHSRAHVCYMLDLTPAQYDKYEQAWDLIAGVYAEVKKTTRERYGTPETPPDTAADETDPASDTADSNDATG